MVWQIAGDFRQVKVFGEIKHTEKGHF